MKVGVKAIEYYLPENILSNDTLATLYPEWTADKIFAKTGISSRHVAGKEECISDMAVEATEKLFRNNEISPTAIDFIILVTENPDYILPPTSCIIQDRLGIPTSSGSIDVNLGCSGYIYGLKLAKALISSGESNNVLLITADLYSKRINPLDKSTRTIFGDAATASIITCGDDVSEIGIFDIGTDGSGYENLIIPAGGCRIPQTNETGIAAMDDVGSVRSQNDIYMNGPEILLFSIDNVPQSIKTVISVNALEFDNINWFVLHQANQYILEYLREKMQIPKEKYIIDLKDLGNTVSSSIPLALKRASEDGIFKRNDKILLSGFGVGMSWGSTNVEYGGKI